MPLEGLWRTDDMREFSVEDKRSWKWTAMIMQPEEYVTNGLVEEARGKHHEIYLSDFRRTKPERPRTVIRQPYVLRALY